MNRYINNATFQIRSRACRRANRVVCQCRIFFTNNERRRHFSGSTGTSFEFLQVAARNPEPPNGLVLAAAAEASKQQSSATRNALNIFEVAGVHVDLNSPKKQIKERLKMILRAFRNDSSFQKFTFPESLTSQQRSYIHEICRQWGDLQSKSSGNKRQGGRRITVSKNLDDVKNEKPAKKRKSAKENDMIPKLRLGENDEARQTLQNYWENFPPLQSEEHGLGDVDKTSLVAMKIPGQNSLPTSIRQRQNHNPWLRKVACRQRRKKMHSEFLESRSANPEYKMWLEKRKQLPAFALYDNIVNTVRANPLTIIVGETGCGKSTQIPQFLFEKFSTSSIVVTQPRRLAAIGIAERVAQEQGAGPVGEGLVGYQVRLESRKNANTQILFVTPGVLLRQMQSSPNLDEYDIIIVDEIHERDQHQEFLMIILRDLLIQGRQGLRIVLMSATMQTKELVKYFEQIQPVFIEIEGRMFPVQEYFLEHILEMTGFIDAVKFSDRGFNQKLQPCSIETKEENNSITNTPLDSTNQTASFKSIQDNHAMKTGNMDPREESCHQRNLVQSSGALSAPDCSQSDGNLSCNGDTLPMVAPRTFWQTSSFAQRALLRKTNSQNTSSSVNNGNLPEVAPHACGLTRPLGTKQFWQAASPSPALEKSFWQTSLPLALEKSGSQKLLKEVCESGDVSNSTSTEKIEVMWDGVDIFDMDIDTGLKITKTQDQLLAMYQSMRTDDRVDMQLVLAVVQYIVKSSGGKGGILIFLPGWEDISQLKFLLESTYPFNDAQRFFILPLHSGISSREQRRVLQKPPDGVCKIVLSTNIAETSLTIDDIVFVVDSGRSKEKNYDPHLESSTLQETWISRASAKQRKGRAGRVRSGFCFHLYSSEQHKKMRQFTESELLRTPLEEICLMCKKLGVAPGGYEDNDGVPAFLSKAMNAPHKQSVNNALNLLIDLGAMMPISNDLTTLGEYLASLSLHPRAGKMVIWSYILGCTRVACAMATGMSYRSPFTLPPPSMKEKAAKSMVELSNGYESDQFLMHILLEKKDKCNREKEFYNFCQNNFISITTLQAVSDCRKNINNNLKLLGFPNPSALSYHNRNDEDDVLWQAAIAAGLYPQVAYRRRGDVAFSTVNNHKALIHVGSVNSVKGQPLKQKCNTEKDALEYLCFGEIVKGSKKTFTVSQTTRLLSPLSILLLCGTSLQVERVPLTENTFILKVDDWMTFECDQSTATQIIVLRKRLESAFWAFLSNPSAGLSNLTPCALGAVDILGTVLRDAYAIDKGNKDGQESPRIDDSGDQTDL